MSFDLARILIRGALLALLLIPGYSAAVFAEGYQLVWSDEFDGTEVDLTKWTFEIGDGCPNLCGWGNNELQYYRSQNAMVTGGFLTITAKEESFGGLDYTSARITSKDKADWTYGRFEMRARLPIGQGLWPAFWMLFTNPVYGTWAASGEVDIMEYIGQDPDRVFGTIHYGGAFPNNVFSGNDYILTGGTFHDDFHTFAAEWEPGEIRWYVDDQLYACQHDWYSTGGPYPAPFDQDFHMILNLAVGGTLPGPPDESTSFPQDYVIDYVRAYQKPSFPGCRIVFAGMDHADPFNNGWFTFNGVGGGGISANTASVAPNVGCAASLNVGWGSGGTPGFFGGFGRNNPRDLTALTHMSFWIDPDPGQDYTLVVQLQDDDNGDDVIPVTPDGADDEFQYDVTVNSGGGDILAGGGWQRISLPLAGFYDDNSYHFGGNGVLDPFSTDNGGNGRLVNVVMSIVSNSGAAVTFRTDRWEFTREEGSVDGIVWWDLDGNGVREGGEPGIGSVTVRILDEFLSPLASAITTPDGHYSLASLPGGESRIDLEASFLGAAVPTKDPDGVSTPNQAWLPLDCSGALTGQDFGYQPAAGAVPDPDAVPGPALYAGVPNPFFVSTKITFALERPGSATLVIYDLSGRRVRELLRAELPVGHHEVVWNGRDDTGRKVAGGIYLAALTTGQSIRTQRVLRLP